MAMKTENKETNEILILLRHIIDQQNRLEGRLARLEEERDFNSEDTIENAGYVEDYFQNIQCLSISKEAMNEILEFNHLQYPSMAIVRDAILWLDFEHKRMKEGKSGSKYYDEVEEAVREEFDHMWDIFEHKWDTGKDY